MVGAATVQQRAEDLFLSLPAVSLGHQCLMCAVGNRPLKLLGVCGGLSAQGFWGQLQGLFHPAPNNSISSRELLPRPQEGSVFWEQSNPLPGWKKKDF